MGNFAAGSTEKLDDYLAHHAVCYNKTPEIKYNINSLHVTIYKPDIHEEDKKQPGNCFFALFESLVK